MKKKLLFLICTFLFFSKITAQNYFDPGYQFLNSGSYVQDKNFYLLTLIEQLPEAKLVLEQDEILANQFQVVKERIHKQMTTCKLDIDCLVDAFYFTADEQQAIAERMTSLIKQEKALQALVQSHMRPSGVFIKYAKQTDAELLVQAWMDVCNGMTFIINTYAKGEKGRYPKIDSVGYDVNSFFYQRVVRTVAHSVEDDLDKQTLFFQPMLQLAMTLLDINYRDEAGRHEPMEMLENRKAYEYIPTINWDNYKYASILQPGHGPEKEGIALSPLGKMRVKLVADRFHEGWAPLIILSGGYVHPFQTPYAEATEMKKNLIEKYGVPARAIIIEPHARHTTTNFRNAARLMYRYGIPTDKRSVCTSTFDQIVYITDPKWEFDKRNMDELGYLPYTLFEKVSRNDIEFKPVITSLFVDSLDPLDP